jgi:Spy/CpxP family protein refolding chaperone
LTPTAAEIRIHRPKTQGGYAMNRKIVWIAAAFFFALTPAHARGMMDGSGMCPMAEKGGDHVCTSACRSQCPVTSKVLRKAGFILDRAQDIGLTDEQKKAVKSVKNAAMKSAIRMQADMEVWMLDLHAKLGEDPFDAEGAKALVDEGSASMAASTKGLIDQYAKLKAVLTAEQIAKLKEMKKNWPRPDEGPHHGSR